MFIKKLKTYISTTNLMMKAGLLTIFLLILLSFNVSGQKPFGQWDFNDPDNLTKATIGDDIQLIGSHLLISGVNSQDKAIRIGKGSYYKIFTGIGANGGGINTNEWSLLIDFKLPSSYTKQWHCFFQTNISNANDGECFIQSGNNSIGVSATGYSDNFFVTPETWYRMVVNVDNGSFYNIYINGRKVLNGTIQTVDGRYSLENSVLLFADDNGEDADIDVSLVALFSSPLSENKISDLAIPGNPLNNLPPLSSNDTYSTLQNTILTITASQGVLTNDKSQDNTPFWASLSSNVKNGILVLNGSGSFTYIPNPNFTGTDFFTYKAISGDSISNEATVTVVVSPNDFSPIAQWDFNDVSNLTKATFGTNLDLIGTHTTTSGINETDGAVRIGAGSYYRAYHGILANGGGEYVNKWSMVIDFKIPSTTIKMWHCLYQTNKNNSNDGDCFIRNSDNAIGVKATGYSIRQDGSQEFTVQAEMWYRMVIVNDNNNLYSIYINGKKVLNGDPQPIDGRYSLSNSILLFADDDWEDNDIDVSMVSMYNFSLSDHQVTLLKGPGGGEVNFSPLTFLTAPYLQNVKTNGITIMWEMSSQNNCQLHYGTSSSYGNVANITTMSSGAGTYIYKAVLNGLSSQSVYHYAIVSGKKSTEDKIFKTAPVANINFSFGVWGDSQGTNGGYYTQDPYQPTKAMMAHMNASGISFAITTGDLAEDGGSIEDTRNYYLNRVAKYLGQDVPWFIAWGNHDGKSTAVIRKYADLPSKERGTPFSPGYGSYSFDYSGCHFICIDDLDRISFQWIEQDLIKAQNARFKFIFIHRAPFYERWYDGEALLRTDLVPLLEKYRVDICFSGHVHEYERGQLNGVFYCVTGGGSWLDYGEPLVKDWPHIVVGGFSNDMPGINSGLINEYVKVDVSEQGWHATVNAFNPDGSIYKLGIDQFGKSNLRDASLEDQTEKGEKFILYPNPTNDQQIIIESPVLSEEAVIEIYNLQGLLVKSITSVNNFRQIIALKGLLTGNYLLVIRAQQKLLKGIFTIK